VCTAAGLPVCAFLALQRVYPAGIAAATLVTVSWGSGGCVLRQKGRPPDRLSWCMGIAPSRFGLREQVHADCRVALIAAAATRYLER